MYFIPSPWPPPSGQQAPAGDVGSPVGEVPGVLVPGVAAAAAGGGAHGGGGRRGDPRPAQRIPARSRWVGDQVHGMDECAHSHMFYLVASKVIGSEKDKLNES